MINRRKFLPFLLGLCAQGKKTPEKQKYPVEEQEYVITGLMDTEDQNDCNIPPLRVKATSRTAAFNKLGNHMTIWTKKEWEDKEKILSEHTFNLMCEGFRKEHPPFK
jgi:hypothetical protein